MDGKIEKFSIIKYKVYVRLSFIARLACKSNSKNRIMTSPKFNPATTIVLLFIILIGAVRVLFNFNYDISPLASFSPIGAMALFGGAQFNRTWKALLFPLGTLFLSDFILHQTVFAAYGNGILYSGWYWVYGAFVLMVFAGRWILKHHTVGRFLSAVLVAVLIHWIVSDIGVWMGSKIYAQTLGGFIDCLIAAIPFELRFFAGTLVYGSILFGGLSLVKPTSARVVPEA